jgi:hypothetical protein
LLQRCPLRYIQPYFWIRRRILISGFLAARPTKQPSTAAWTWMLRFTGGPMWGMEARWQPKPTCLHRAFPDSFHGWFRACCPAHTTIFHPFGGGHAPKGFSGGGKSFGGHSRGGGATAAANITPFEAARWSVHTCVDEPASRKTALSSEAIDKMCHPDRSAAEWRDLLSVWGSKHATPSRLLILEIKTLPLF